MLAASHDRRELDEMVFKYALALDQRDWKQYRSLLTDDVVFDFSDHGLSPDGAPDFVEGGDQVAAAAGKVLQGFDATQHCITNIVHEIDGDIANIRCYLTAEHFLNNDRGDRSVSCGARYEIRARRTGDGWKIARLNFITMWFRGNTGLYAMAAARAATNKPGKPKQEFHVTTEKKNLISNSAPLLWLASKNRKPDGSFVVHPRAFRIGALVLGIFSVLVIPVLVFGDQFEIMLDGNKALAFLRSLGPWSAIVAIGMIMADLFLPLPSPAIMASLGLIYGPLVGGLLAGFGSFSAGMIAYGLCRVFGKRVSVFIAGDDDVNKMSAFFARYGVWAIALSRWAPALPEILSCMAGFARMPIGRYAFGNLAGSLAVGFAYAYFGAKGEANPGGVILISVFAPLLVLPLFLFFIARSNKHVGASKVNESRAVNSSENDDRDFMDAVDSQRGSDG